jgi:hypothetical protein
MRASANLPAPFKWRLVTTVPWSCLWRNQSISTVGEKKANVKRRFRYASTPLVLFTLLLYAVIVQDMAPLRPRSAGVTAAATFALLGCSSAFFLWGYVFLMLLNAPADEKGQHFYQMHPVAFLLIALVPSGVIALGVRTGIGLFQLRPWARIAAMIWASLTLVLCLCLIALRPFETFFIPDHFVGPTESFNQLMAIALVILLLPASVWWLFLFRMQNVKMQFRGRGAGDRGQESPVTSKA